VRFPTIVVAYDHVDVIVIFGDGRDVDAWQTRPRGHRDRCVCVGFEGTAFAAERGTDSGRVAHAHRVAAELGMLHSSVNPEEVDSPPPGTPSLAMQGVSAAPVTVDTTLTVTPDALPHLDLARQRILHGEEDLIMLQDASAPTTVTFILTTPGDTLAPTTDGGALILDSHHQPVAVIAAPWAHDAAGTSIPTAYTITPTTLTQTITPPTTATYPITADPKITWGIITGTIYFNKAETAQVAATAGFVASLARYLPSPWNTVLDLFANYYSFMAAYVLTLGECLAIKSTTYAYGYRGSYCQ